MKTKLLLTSFLLGALIVPIGDWVHVRTGTTGYPLDVYHWYVGGVPFWVPLLFGSASFTMTVGLLVLDRIFPKRMTMAGQLSAPAQFSSVVYAGLLFQGVYLLSGLLTWFHPQGNFGFNDFVLAGVAIFSWWQFDRTGLGIILGALNAVIGVAFEANLVRLGVFWYLPGADHLFGVGSWLPWIYLAASPALRTLHSYFRSDF